MLSVDIVSYYGVVMVIDAEAYVADATAGRCSCVCF